MKVYQAINSVQRALSRTGIAKDRKNTQGNGYMFRGIDDVYNALAPLLAEHGLCILPRMLSRESVERQSKSGGALFYITVDAEFDFVCAEDGSKHTVKTFGEAMDSGDKATNKAMSAAYKYAAFQAFAIPTEGDNDADAQTHEVAARADVHKTGALEGMWESMNEEQKERLRKHAVLIREYIEAEDPKGCVEYLARMELNGVEERAALWSQLSSKVRTAIKVAQDTEKQMGHNA